MKIFLDMDQGDAYLDFWVALNFPLSLKPIYLSIERFLNSRDGSKIKVLPTSD